MRSNICTLKKDMPSFGFILDEAEKTAVYNELDERQSMRLRLLAEELICMLPELLEYGSGELWIENDGKEFEIHVSLRARNPIELDREKILSVSKSGKNAAAVGILNKIRIAAEIMMADYSEVAGYSDYDFYGMGIRPADPIYASLWSLEKYREQAKNEEEWDELEKSIIANLADDVTVGIIGRKVDIIVKKNFK